MEEERILSNRITDLEESDSIELDTEGSESTCNSWIEEAYVPKKATSPCWEYMRIRKDKKDTVTCIYPSSDGSICGANLTYKSTTSHLIAHIKGHSDTAIVQSQPEITQWLKEPRKRQILWYMLKLVVNNRPFNQRNDKLELEFCRTLNANYAGPPDEKTLVKYRDMFFNKMKTVLSEQISSKTNIVFTMDSWKKYIPYIGVLATYIHNWEIVTTQVGLIDTEGASEKAEYISEQIKKIKGEYGISQRVQLVTDGGRNYESCGINSLEVEFYSRCSSHKLQNCILKAFELTPAVDNLKHHCNTVVTHFNSSAEATKLKRIQLVANTPAKKFKKANDTRWWSRQEMMKSVLDEMPALELFKLEHLDFTLGEHENKILKQVVNFLGEVKGLFKILESDNEVTISSVIPSWNNLSDIVDKFIGDRSSTTEAVEFVSTFFRQFESKFKEGKDLFNAASMLDIRFKRERNLEYDKFVDFCKKELGEIPTQIDSDNRTLKKRNILISSRVSGDVSNLLDTEIQSYLNLPADLFFEDPLLWWKNFGVASYPFLSKIAFKVLLIPATSAPVERLFSSTGGMLSPKRNRFLSSSVEKNSFIKKNWETLKTEMDLGYQK